jgi:thioesterase-3
MAGVVSIKVRGYHVDMYGHVNNARYLEFLEEARWALLEQVIDLPSALREGPALVVVGITINYRGPARVGDELEVSARISSIGEHSGTFHQEVRSASSGSLVVDADVTFVPLDQGTGRPVPIEGALRELLDRLV